MAFKFEFPVKLPRWTKEEFDLKRQAYTAKHGYEIHVPGFEDIFHWKWINEPSPSELALYKSKDVPALGEKRYEEIKSLMLKKKEKFLRILSSPTPRYALNAGAVMTFLDDVNDAVGTLGVAARTAAHLLPRTAAKFVTGPAGWAFLAADITNIAMNLSRLPWKAKRLQHDFHSAMDLNPLSKKAKLRRLYKLKRFQMSKGEAIEFLQTTDNIFGVGLCLGPIVGLVQDVAFGMYRAFQGREVKVTGLPTPFYYADRIAQRFFRGCAQLWYGNPDIDDHDKGMTMVAFNYATQWQKTMIGDNSSLDFIDDPADIELPVHGPIYPSTVDVIESEVGRIEDYLNWPATGEKWMSTNQVFDHDLDQIQENIKSWQDRNKRDMESSVCMQNAIESGMNSLALLEGDDAVEWTYDAVSLSYLKMFNSGYRLPLNTTPEQLECFTNHLAAYGSQGIEPNIHEILSAAFLGCGFELTTEVPERPELTEEEKEEQRKHALDSLKKWYFKDLHERARFLCFKAHMYAPYYTDLYTKKASEDRSWLNYYGWPAGEPDATLSLYNEPSKSCISQYLQ